MLKFLSRARSSLIANPLFGFAKFNRDKPHVNGNAVH